MNMVKRILLISHEMTYTGAPRSLLNMARVLRKNGYDITVWSLQPGIFEREFAASGFPVSVIHAGGAGLGDVIKGYDLVILNTFFCASLLSAVQPFVRTILYIREGHNIAELAKSCGLDIRDIERAEEVICVSEYAAEFIMGHCRPQKLHVVHNFVRDEYQGGLNLTHGHMVNYLISGTVEPRKGHDIAIRAFLDMPEELHKITRLHIVGRRPGWSEPFWKDLIPDDERIIDHGEISDEKKRIKLYRQMNVFVVASRDEACSLVALEGAMLGKAVIFSANTGAQYLDPKGRRVYPTENANALCRQMCELTGRKRLLTEGLRMRRQYGKTSTEEQYLRRIENVIQGGDV